jgi:hypothetical protein
MSYDVEFHGGVLALDPEWDAGLRVVLTFPHGASGMPGAPPQSGFVGFP